MKMCVDEKSDSPFQCAPSYEEWSLVIVWATLDIMPSSVSVYLMEYLYFKREHHCQGMNNFQTLPN